MPRNSGGSDDNRANQLNPNNRLHTSNRFNQLNPNNDAFWRVRGFDRRPNDWRERLQGEG